MLTPLLQLRTKSTSMFKLETKMLEESSLACSETSCQRQQKTSQPFVMAALASESQVNLFGIRVLRSTALSLGSWRKEETSHQVTVEAENPSTARNLKTKTSTSILTNLCC